MERRPAVTVAWVLLVALALTAPRMLAAALKAALSSVSWLLTSDAGAVVLAVGLVATLLYLAVSTLRRHPVHVPRRWAW